jgi:heat shock protein HtpX
MLVGSVGAAAGMVVALVLVFLVPWPAALGVGLVAGVAVAWGCLRAAPRRALRLAGGAPADTERHARLINLVEGLSLAAGVPPPDLYVLDGSGPNALTLGLDPRRARLIVTSGLLDGLNRIELEGVLAHELSHVRTGDIRTATLAAGLLSAIGFLGRPAATTFQWLIGPQRESLADLRAVSLTRYPPGLVAALEVMAEAATDPPAGLSVAVLPLWIAPPAGAGAADPRPAFDFQPALVTRIEALREL